MPQADSPQALEPVDAHLTLQHALHSHRLGDARTAQALCRQVLQTEPRNPAALHMLGVLATQQGDAQRALALIAHSIAIDPSQAGAYSNLGNALMSLGRYDEALECFDRALELQPSYAIACANRGISLIHLGRYELAVASLSRALEENPHRPEVFFNRGLALEKLGRLEEAIADYGEASSLKPAYLEPVFNRALLLQGLHRMSEAVAAYDTVIRLRANHIEALNNRGLALMELERCAEALESFDRVLHFAPTAVYAHNNRGLALRHLKRLDAALDSFDRALSLSADFPEALSNRGWILLQLGLPHQALTSLRRALALRPDFAEALTNLGAVFKYLVRPHEALQYFDKALAVDPDCQDALGNRGVILTELRRYPEAIACFKRLLALAPRNEYALGNLLEAQLRCCDWSEHETVIAQVIQSISGARAAIRPFFLLAVTDDPAHQLACSRLYAERHYPCLAMSLPSRARTDRKLRLAYVSGDLGDHAVSYLTAGLFETHDRARFEVIAVSLRPPHDSEVGRRVRSAFDRFLDVSSVGDQEVVATLRDLEVDIAIDLSGYTGASRTALFAQRSAPLQVSYLGFPATMGSACIDYIIADEFVIPPQSRAHYAEQIVYMPDCFQVNDDRRQIGGSAVSRVSFGLPEQGVVLCSFNNSYKLSPTFFSVWLRLLDAVPAAVLWLVRDNDWVVENLRRVAAGHGIDPERLVFTPRLAYPEHLARLGLADLFLDSLPFNAGTTASDALWAGVPLLTCAGEGLASRMAGSLLRAVGLPELITYNTADYEALALRLATDRALLNGFRARLAANRRSSPLFDTARFCRDLESAYTSMWARHCRGEAPADFRVANQLGSEHDRR